MENKELIKLIKIMKREGVQTIKMPTLEIQLAQQALHKRVRVAKSKSDYVPTDELSEEDILMWSAPDVTRG